MSVAFRRESDEEHLEPKFEIPIPSGANIVTPRGLAMIEARAVALEAAITAETEEEPRKVLQRELRYWKTRRATARVASPPEDGVAGIGTRVRIRMNGKDRVIEIVGHDEADPTADRIAYSAPLAHALVGAGAGERVDFGGRSEAIELVEITGIADAGCGS